MNLLSPSLATAFVQLPLGIQFEVDVTNACVHVLVASLDLPLNKKYWNNKFNTIRNISACIIYAREAGWPHAAFTDRVEFASSEKELVLVTLETLVTSLALLQRRERLQALVIQLVNVLVQRLEITNLAMSASCSQ